MSHQKFPKGLFFDNSFRGFFVLANFFSRDFFAKCCLMRLFKDFSIVCTSRISFIIFTLCFVSSAQNYYSYRTGSSIGNQFSFLRKKSRKAVRIAKQCSTAEVVADLCLLEGYKVILNQGRCPIFYFFLVAASLHFP